MDIHTFIANYQEAFGQHAELPIAFLVFRPNGGIYREVTGCSLQMHETSQRRQNRQSQQQTITCRRGKFYTGFTEMPEARPGVCLFEKRNTRRLPKWW